MPSYAQVDCEDHGGKWINDDCHYSLAHRASEWIDDGSHVALIAVVLAAILLGVAIWVFRPTAPKQ